MYPFRSLPARSYKQALELYRKARLRFMLWRYDPSSFRIPDGMVSRHVADETDIRLFCFFSPSYRPLAERWLFPGAGEFEVVEGIGHDAGHSISYTAKGWDVLMCEKVDFIIDAIVNNFGAMIVFSDADVQFFGFSKKVVRELLVDNDILFQRDDPSGTACAGFFLCIASERTLEFWLLVRSLMSVYPDDQVNANAVLQSGKVALRWDYMPVELCIGGGTVSGVRWEPGDPLHVPAGLLVHHANWTVGMQNKEKQLAYVKLRRTGQ